MRSNTAEKPLYRSEERAREQPEAPLQPLMTPARRMALEALEREFQDLIKANPR